jgi:hypothetical protein
MVGGAQVPPHVVGRSASISCLAAASATDVVLVPLVKSVTLGFTTYVVDELEAAATTAADLEAALAALGAAGCVRASRDRRRRPAHALRRRVPRPRLGRDRRRDPASRRRADRHHEPGGRRRAADRWGTA